MKGPSGKRKVGRVKRLRLQPVISPKTSPAVHVRPEDFAALKRDAKRAKAPTLASYVAAAMRLVRGRLTWLPDGRIQLMMGTQPPWLSPLDSTSKKAVGHA